jgi:glutathione synthase/RimK-type ligase-like ATP-grasp enzyme
VPTSDGDFGIFTQRVDDDMLAQLDESLPCPIILQEEIGKKYDIRVTVVGNRVFSSAIDSQADPAARVDWRRTVDPDLPHYRHALPFELTQQCLVLMSQLGLVYGTLDFVLGNDGQYTFLEVNPNGEWLWLEDKLDYPISDAIADWLVTPGPQL